MNHLFYNKHGYAILQYLSGEDYCIIKEYALNKLNRLFQVYSGRTVTELDIQSYHLWGGDSNVPHSEMLKAKNRHLSPPPNIFSLLDNQALKDFLKSIGVLQYRFWDIGLGSLAFRLIRPFPGDGYPFSCKNWGPAKNVLSFWIPILGFDPEVTLCLLPGSHLKNYPRFLPKKTHFTKEEYRLALTPLEDECLRPHLTPGQAICYHPQTIHAEEIEQGTCTRFNLEFRIEPL